MVANATVIGRSTESIFRGDIDGVTGPDGTMQVERDLVDMLLLVKSSDEQLAGIAKVSAEAQEATVHLASTASARGRLMDTDGELMANTELQCAIQLSFPDGQLTHEDSRPIVTDGQARFELFGMCRGAEYKLWLVADRDGDGQPDLWRPIVTLTPNAKMIELGDVRLPPPLQRLGSATPLELATKAFAARTRYFTRRAARQVG